MKTLKFLSLAILLASCSSTNDMDEDINNKLSDTDILTDNESDETSSVSEVSYAVDIAPIMTQHCISCHRSSPSNGASASLTNASEVRQSIESFNLIGRIESGNMPKSAARLNPTDIEKVKVWQEEGFKD